MRRDPHQVDRDRAKLIRHVHEAGTTWVRSPEWARASDVQALVRSGVLRREVRREWDKAVGYQRNLFGGAAVMQRHRAYLALSAKLDDQEEGAA